MRIIKITADTNDADYVYEETQDPTGELTEKIREVVKAILAFKPYKVGMHTHHHNFPTGDCIREDLGEKSAEQLYQEIEGFDEFVKMIPGSEYGIHSIDRIEVFEVKELERLL